jgi:hypothetical protein
VRKHCYKQRIRPAASGRCWPKYVADSPRSIGSWLAAHRDALVKGARRCPCANDAPGWAGRLHSITRLVALTGDQLLPMLAPHPFSFSCREGKG